MMAVLQWHKVYKLGEDELHRAPVVALKSVSQYKPTELKIQFLYSEDVTQNKEKNVGFIFGDCDFIHVINLYYSFMLSGYIFIHIPQLYSLFMLIWTLRR